jgi:DNA-binding transcriptional LysR family regulator
MRGADFANLRAFAAICEAGSFGQAAKALDISASALSQTIRGLEARLGVRLFNRTTRSVTQTEAGAKLYRRIAPLFVEFDFALEELNGFRSTPAGTVRICAPQVAILHLIRPILGGFQKKYPDIVLDLASDDSVDDIVARGFDAGIRLGEFVDKDMIAVKLGPPLRQVAIASPLYLSNNPAPRTPADLAEHRCINWRRPGQHGVYIWEFTKEGQRLDVAVKGSLIVNDCSVALRTAMDGLGVTLWVEQWIEEELRTGQLVSMLDDWAPVSSGFQLYYPSRRQVPAALRAFIDYAKEATSTPLVQSHPGSEATEKTRSPETLG